MQEGIVFTKETLDNLPLKAITHYMQKQSRIETLESSLVAVATNLQKAKQQWRLNIGTIKSLIRYLFRTIKHK